MFGSIAGENFPLHQQPRCRYGPLLGDAGVDHRMGNSYWRAETPAISSSALRSGPTLSIPIQLRRCLRRQSGTSSQTGGGDAGVRRSLSVRVSHLPRGPGLSSRLSRRLVPPVRPSAALSLHLSARGYILGCCATGMLALPPGGCLSPPPPPPEWLGHRQAVWGEGLHHNLSNVLNVTVVIHGGHNPQ